MQVDVNKLKEIGLKHGVAMMEEMAVEIAFPLLKQAVAESETKIDDAIIAALEEPMKKAVVEMIKKLKAM